MTTGIILFSRSHDVPQLHPLSSRATLQQSNLYAVTCDKNNKQVEFDAGNINVTIHAKEGFADVKGKLPHSDDGNPLTQIWRECIPWMDDSSVHLARLNNVAAPAPTRP